MAASSAARMWRGVREATTASAMGPRNSIVTAAPSGSRSKAR